MTNLKPIRHFYLGDPAAAGRRRRTRRQPGLGQKRKNVKRKKPRTEKKKAGAPKRAGLRLLRIAF